MTLVVRDAIFNKAQQSFAPGLLLRLASSVCSARWCRKPTGLLSDVAILFSESKFAKSPTFSLLRDQLVRKADQ